MKIVEKFEVIDTDVSLEGTPSKEDVLTSNEKSALSRKAHSEDIAQYNKEQNALCFVVFGVIALIIGVLFIFLSLKKRINVIVGIDYTSLQFYVCVICLAGGLFCLIFGLVRFFMAFNKRRELKDTINSLNNIRTKD